MFIENTVNTYAQEYRRRNPVTCCNVYINGLLIIINSNGFIRLISFVICRNFIHLKEAQKYLTRSKKISGRVFFNKMRRTVSLNNEIEVYTVVYWNRIVFSKSFPNIYRLQVELFSVNHKKI